MFRFERRIARPVLATILATLLGGRAAVFGAQGLTLPPNGDNPQAVVSQAIGPVRVTIDYSSPRVVRGKNDRRGKIWGEVVPYGMSDLGFNGCTSCPWRAGANENTTFTVTHDVKIQGQTLPAGTYGLHMIPGTEGASGRSSSRRTRPRGAATSTTRRRTRSASRRSPARASTTSG